MKACDVVCDNMIAYRDMYDLMEGSFDGCELCHVGRASNEEADMLANIGSTCAPIPPGVFLEQIDHRSVKIKTLTDLAGSASQPEATPTVDLAAPATADDPPCGGGDAGRANMDATIHRVHAAQGAA